MKRNKLSKPILLSTLVFGQCAGTVVAMQNSVVQVYAEQKNKEVTSQEFLDYINQLKEQNPNFKFNQGETKVFDSEEQLLAFQKKFGKKAKGTLRHATQMNVLRCMLQREYPDAELTYGFITKEVRRVFDLEKSHIIDACCIASRGTLYKNNVSNKYKKKCVSNGDYPRTNTTNGKHVIIPKGKIAGFRRYDKVLYNNKEYFVAGRESKGYVTLIDMDNHRPQVERTKRSTGEKYLAKASIKASLVRKVASAKTCVITCGD